MKARLFTTLSLAVTMALLPLRFHPEQPASRMPKPAQDGDPIERVSLGCSGAQANGRAVDPSISADGRYVAFESEASNLVSDDTNGGADIFVYDRRTGQIERVSVASGGAEADDYSENPFISATGRYVTFESYATNLVGDDTNGVGDVFVHDRQTGQTTRVSVASDGTQTVYYHSKAPVISSDGRYVAFSSQSERLAPVDTVSRANIFLRDRQTGQTTCISRPPSGTQDNLNSVEPTISADGRYVAFRSWADNLVSGDTNSKNHEDIFVHDRDVDGDGVYDESGQIGTARRLGRLRWHAGESAMLGSVHLRQWAVRGVRYLG